jgi:predicted amidophosphoribosyltransferase
LILAKTAGEAWGIKVDIKSLERVKWTTPQTVLSKNERQKRIRGSFSCSPERVRDKNLLIIDDIYTSGSTVSECAKILKKNGALKVDVLTFARTI